MKGKAEHTCEMFEIGSRELVPVDHRQCVFAAQMDAENDFAEAMEQAGIVEWPPALRAAYDKLIEATYDEGFADGWLDGTPFAHE